MVVSNVAFIPPFVLGTAFLLAPCFAIGLIAGDTASLIAGCLLAVAAFVFAKNSFYFSNMLCALRTVSFLGVIIRGAMLWVGGADIRAFPVLVVPLLVAIAAHWRIQRLIQAGTLAI